MRSTPVDHKLRSLPNKPPTPDADLLCRYPEHDSFICHRHVSATSDFGIPCVKIPLFKMVSFYSLIFQKSYSNQVALVVKNPPANAGDGSDASLIPGLGRSPAVGNGNPLQCSCLGNAMDRGAWWATVHGVTESDTAERPSTR